MNLSSSFPKFIPILTNNAEDFENLLISEATCKDEEISLLQMMFDGEPASLSLFPDLLLRFPEILLSKLETCSPHPTIRRWLRRVSLDSPLGLFWDVLDAGRKLKLPTVAYKLRNCR